MKVWVTSVWIKYISKQYTIYNYFFLKEHCGPALSGTKESKSMVFCFVFKLKIPSNFFCIKKEGV